MKKVSISLGKLCLKLTKCDTIKNSFNEVIWISLQLMTWSYVRIAMIIYVQLSLNVTTYVNFAAIYHREIWLSLQCNLRVITSYSHSIFILFCRQALL